MGSMQDFGHHRQSLHGPRAYARRQQEFGKIRRPTVGSRCQISVQPPCDHIAGSDLMMVGQDQMRQQRLCSRRRVTPLLGDLQRR